MTRAFRLTAPAIADMKEIADYLATQADFNQADRFLLKADQKFISQPAARQTFPPGHSPNGHN